MPRGFEGFKKVKDSLGSGSKAEFLKLKAGESVRVRVLDFEDVAYALVHRAHVNDADYPVDVTCLDQNNNGEDCPACEARLPRRLKFFLNVLDRDNKQVKVWSAGRTVWDTIEEKDEEYDGGISGRDFVISREGSGKNDTKYKVIPYKENGKTVKPAALPAAEKKIAEAGIVDTNHYVKVPSYQELSSRLSLSQTDDNEEPELPKSPWSSKGEKQEGNMFAKA